MTFIYIYFSYQYKSWSSCSGIFQKRLSHQHASHTVVSDTGRWIGRNCKNFKVIFLFVVFDFRNKYIYKWADFIQIVCTGQNLVAMLKYKYFLFFFYRISCIMNNWKPMFCSMTFWWTVYFTRSEIFVNLQFLV